MMAHEDGFTPISPNPYIVGNPVRDPSMFFGRDAEFEQVQRFLRREEGGLLVFCGERRSGKTSILFQILTGRLGEEYIPVLIDMQSMAVQNEAEFLGRIAEEIHAALGDRGATEAGQFWSEDVRRTILPTFRLDADADTKPALAFQNYIRRVMRRFPDKKPILMFDEYELFEDKIEDGVLTEELLNMLSHLANHLHVYVIFTGSQHLEKRQKPYWRILGQSQWKSVSYLEAGDALKLIRNPVAERVTYAEETDEAILRLTAGQPFYTQGVCQRLVDHLNEARTNTASQELLSHVVKDIVDNAFAQMVFLWENLEQDQKLTLALLAEALEDENDHASSKKLFALFSSRKYPVALDEARIATALDSLFHQELLTATHQVPAEYAFRMDIWRHWIKVMHSVWQVMSELGIPWKVPWYKRRLRAVVATTAASVLALLTAAVYVIVDPGRVEVPLERQIETPSIARVVVRVPGVADADVQHSAGEELARVGDRFRFNVEAQTDTEFKVTAPGYADTTLTVRPDSAGQHLDLPIELRRLWGELVVATNPHDATIRVFDSNDERVDEGTLSGDGFWSTRLPAAERYRVEASRSGHDTAWQILTVLADTTMRVVLDLPLATQRVYVSSRPHGASILIDGKTQLRKSSFVNLTVGRHQFQAELTGYERHQSTHAVTPETTEIVVTMVELPSGRLRVHANDGLQVTKVRVNDDVREGSSYGYWFLDMRPGPCNVSVVLSDGSTVEDVVEILPAKAVYYDAVRKTTKSESIP